MRDRLEGIYREHGQGLLTLAWSITSRRELAEDAVHEAFVRLCRMNEMPAGDPVAYTFASVRNAALDQLRRRPTEKVDQQSIFLAQPAAKNTSPDLPALTDERDKRLRQCVDELSPPLREAVVLRVYGNLTFEQMAEVCDEKLSTVSSRYRRALEHLRKSVETLV